MKKIILAAILLISANAFDLLPQKIQNCVAVAKYTSDNPLAPIEDSYAVLKKYSCDNEVVYIGIANKLPGFLTIKKDKDTKDFLIKHFTINNYQAAVYVDKNLKKGVIAVKLDDCHSLNLFFNGTDYQKYVELIKTLDLEALALPFAKK